MFSKLRFRLFGFQTFTLKSPILLQNQTWKFSIARWESLSPLQQLPSPTEKFETSNLCRAIYRQLPISSKKLTPVARLVRKMKVQDALYQCDLLQRKGARIVENAIRSARANGMTNHGLDGDKLVVQECYATNGRDLKRIRIHGRGRFGNIRRRRTHLTVILREDGNMKLTPHVIQQTWMQRELQKVEGIRPKLNKMKTKERIRKPRLKWKRMLRIQKIEKHTERKNSKAAKREAPSADGQQRRQSMSTKFIHQCTKDKDEI